MLRAEVRRDEKERSFGVEGLIGQLALYFIPLGVSFGANVQVSIVILPFVR